MADPPGWTLLFAETFPTDCAEGAFLATYPNWVSYSAGPDTYGANPTRYGGPASDAGLSRYNHGDSISVTSGVMSVRLFTGSDGIAYGAASQHKFPGQTSFASGHTYFRHQFDLRVVIPGGQTGQGYYAVPLLWPDTNVWTAEDDFPEGPVNTTSWSGFHHHANDVHTQDSYSSGLSFAAWHTFTQEWTADLIKWYVDGTLVKTLTNGVPAENMRGPTFQFETVPSPTVRPLPNTSVQVQVRNLSVWLPSATTNATARVRRAGLSLSTATATANIRRAGLSLAGTNATARVRRAGLSTGAPVGTATARVRRAGLSLSADLQANAGPDQVADAGAVVTLDGTASSGATSLGYAWTQTTGPTVTLSSSTAATPTFTAPATTVGTTCTFALTVGSGASSSAPDSIAVTVLPQTLWLLSKAGTWVAAYDAGVI